MLKNKVISFLVFGVLIHLLLFAASCVFFGLQPALVIFFLWACIWIIYCGNKETPLLSGEEEEEVFSDGEESTLPMAVAGGPWCWLLSPTCLLPKFYGKSMRLGIGWNMASKLLRVFCRSLLRILMAVHNYCAEIFAVAEQSAGQGDVKSDADDAGDNS